MKMKRILRRLRGKKKWNVSPVLMLFSLFFLGGLLLGNWAAAGVGPAGLNGNDLLSFSAGLENMPDAGGAFLSAFFRTGILHWLVWALGFFAFGFLILPLLFFLKGFSLAFSSAYFFHSLGFQGMGAAFLALAPQNLILLPALFFTALLSYQQSSALFMVGAGFQAAEGPVFTSKYWALLPVLALAVLVAVMIQYALAPYVAGLLT